MMTTHRGSHPGVTRRTAVQAGALGLLGLGMNHLDALRAATPGAGPAGGTAKSCIYIFLSGGLAQHESFDMKPDAPDGVRGEFSPIASATPGIDVCEHLPGLAQRSRHWALVRSLTHGTNDHTLGHYLMLTGRSKADPGFRGDRQPRPTDWPSMASVVGDAFSGRGHHLPPAIVLPDRLVHWSGGVLAGLYGGQMGSHRDPFFIEASPYGNPFWKGAYPEYSFPNETKKPPKSPDERVFQAPSLTLSPGMTAGRLAQRTELLDELDRQRGVLEATAVAERFDRHRQSAISLLASPEVRYAFDVTKADEPIQERYGKNSFGWSLLMASRLVEAGVPLIQVNLGSNETWDTHGDMFPRLKDKLFPPTDRALSALLDDLEASGLLDSTLVVMASEFGRTPKLSILPESYQGVGRDHWGALQSVWFAGGGVRGGTVIGSSDKIGAYPTSLPQTPENMAATIYKALGIPDVASWRDDLDRPHLIYQGSPIPGLI
ncbi:DUF1501 domain-containing protein [Planctomyces sp. SH-PL62]|uniref:DUF1501 domain-containing protein n=1 Tax=Planctomyces sp. SH-PL62 TaxID=1636152 RepID=UPI00078D51BF|nr:DUF1501 domain-containing protein [Planctomyces sp. SH-PL62]AMV38790.1 hypothetical protein VT85_15245 [Planctomyces sp. SH-PL62]